MNQYIIRYETEKATGTLTVLAETAEDAIWAVLSILAEQHESAEVEII